jgi:hypothetical protein
MNLASLRRAAAADNMSVFAIRSAMPMDRRCRMCFARLLAGTVLGFMVGISLGLAFAAGVHSGACSPVVALSLALLAVPAAARRIAGSPTTSM